MSRAKLVVLAVLLTAPVAPADDVGSGPLFLYFGGYGGTCWQEIRLFHTLRHGYFPYCRERMRYRPGRLECAQVTERVCTVVDPVSLQLVEARIPSRHTIVPCPDGPAPPLCRKLDFR